MKAKSNKVTFSLINTALHKINNKIKLLENLEKNDLERETRLVTRSIIRTDISRIPYGIVKFEPYHILLALIISALFVYIFGNTFIEDIKQAIVSSNILNSETIKNLSTFNIIKNLNMETFIFIVLIPLLRVLLKHFTILGLEKRNQRLQESLEIVERRLGN